MYWTYGELKTKIRTDLDIQDEDAATAIIGVQEMLDYTNESIDRAAQLVHTLYEDYFIAKTDLTFVSGQEEYDLPTDLYAHKIRRLMYREGSKVYKIARIPNWHKFEEYTLDRVNNSENYMSYFLLNPTPTAHDTLAGPKILITPIPQINGAYGTIWYIRSVNKLTGLTSILDIPEANNLILQYVKVRCLEKMHDPKLEKAMGDLVREEGLLTDTLTGMIPDADNEIEADFSNYQEMS